MSETIITGTDAEGRQKMFATFRNAWGTAPVIWDRLSRHMYWIPEEPHYQTWLNMAAPGARDESKFWGLWSLEKVPDYERIAMATTLDNVYVPASAVPLVAKVFRAAGKWTGPGRVNHLPVIADRMEEMVRKGCEAITFWWTSVTEDPWEIEEYLEDDETGETVFQAWMQTPLDDGRSIVDLLPDLFNRARIEVVFR